MNSIKTKSEIEDAVQRFGVADKLRMRRLFSGGFFPSAFPEFGRQPIAKIVHGLPMCGGPELMELLSDRVHGMAVHIDIGKMIQQQSDGVNPEDAESFLQPITTFLPKGFGSRMTLVSGIDRLPLLLAPLGAKEAKRRLHQELGFLRAHVQNRRGDLVVRSDEPLGTLPSGIWLDCMSSFGVINLSGQRHMNVEDTFIAEFDDREIPLDSFARRMLRQEAELASNCTNNFPPLVLSYMDAMVSEVEKKYKAGMDVGSALGSGYPALDPTGRGFHSAPRAQAFFSAIWSRAPEQARQALLEVPMGERVARNYWLETSGVVDIGRRCRVPGLEPWIAANVPGAPKPVAGDDEEEAASSRPAP